MPSHSENPEHNSEDAAGDTQSDRLDSAVERVIVDEQGEPYIHKPNLYKKLKRGIDRILDHIPHGDRLMIFLTAIIALSTIGQFYIARKGVDNTNKAMIVTERAYLDVPQVVTDTKGTHIVIVNYGHVPSGSGLLDIYMVSYQAPARSEPQISTKSQTSCAHLIQDVSNVTPANPRGGFLGVVEDPSAIQNGLIDFEIVGEIAYNDGFPDTELHKARFCYTTTKIPELTTNYTFSCNAFFELNRLRSPNACVQGKKKN